MRRLGDDVQVEASSYAESQDIVFWPILHKADTIVATSMKKAGDATNEKEAAEALDSLLLMNEAWYATPQRHASRPSSN
jgi:hypothetical protein